jgi:DNA segregation ATPase FtsK/SpoIIIE-like protein
VACLGLGAVLGWNVLRSEADGWLPALTLGVLRRGFGLGASAVPALLLVLGVLLTMPRQRVRLGAWARNVGIALMLALAGVHLSVPAGQEFAPLFMQEKGGVLGAGAAWALRLVFGEVGAALALGALAVVALLLLTPLSLSQSGARVGSWGQAGFDFCRDGLRSLWGTVTDWAHGSRAARQERRQHRRELQQHRLEQLGQRYGQQQFDFHASKSDEDIEEEGSEFEEEPAPSRVSVPRRSSAAPSARPGPIRRRTSADLDPSGEESGVLGAQLLARAAREERERRSPFFAVDEIAGHSEPETPFDRTLGEASLELDAEQVLASETAMGESVPNTVRIDIDLSPPPPSVVLAAPQVLGAAEEDDAETDLIPINAPDEDLTPNEALEAQALATARAENEAPKRRRAHGPRRSFGDGPLMPEYFDQAVTALDPPIIPDLSGVEEDIRQSIGTVEETLASFKVDARVTDVKRGPVITRYEVQPAPGVRVATIANLDRDLARSLAAHAVRIEAPVPGKDVVGIEIPNKKVHLVRLRDVLELPDFLSAQSKLAFVLGKDIAGQPKWADLTKMPHMLVAGATNSGKSVCLNTIITSIITRASPDEVKFSLIDPKRVELTLYRDIPHLYHPVVVEPKDAVKVLRGMIVEMDRRYKKFAERGVRNISSFNQKLEEDEMPLPYIVIVIDELADLMMTAAAEFEKLICRLAQLARATGIHLIVATQRPSVNVITGVIKANIPARVAFAVASQVDSRTILDAVGAERLIGSGDMLFDANNGGKAVRIQGAYLSEEEVNRIVEVVKTSYRDEPREYGLDLSAMEDDDANEEKAASKGSSDDRRDSMYDEIKEFVIRHQEVSASMIQRKYEIGFPRAARIVDQFERDGLLGPADGPKPRKVLGNGNS